MARDVSEGLRALLDSKRFESHLCFAITLRDDTPLYFASSRALVDLGDETVEFIPMFKGEDLDALKMSLTEVVDRVAVQFQNVDREIGQTVSGSDNLFNNAIGVHGIIFIDLDTGDVYFDEKIPGDMVPGLVHEEKAAFTLYSDLEMGQIAGTTLGEAFPSSEPVAVVDRPDPNDLPSVDPSGGGGRYPIPFVPDTGNPEPIHRPFEPLPSSGGVF